MPFDTVPFGMWNKSDFKNFFLYLRNKEKSTYATLAMDRYKDVNDTSCSSISIEKKFIGKSCQHCKTKIYAVLQHGHKVSGLFLRIRPDERKLHVKSWPDSRLQESLLSYDFGFPMTSWQEDKKRLTIAPKCKNRSCVGTVKYINRYITVGAYPQSCFNTLSYSHIETLLENTANIFTLLDFIDYAS